MSAPPRVPGAAALGLPALAPTPRDVVMRDGTASLLRFRRADNAPGAGGVDPDHGSTRHAAPRSALAPVLLVPSLINRWYVLDLRPGGSLAEVAVQAGLETFCLDWGTPEDEDRFLTWDDLLARLARAVRKVQRLTGAPRVSLLGYCLGGTLSAIHAALEPHVVASLVSLAGPIDFAHAGMLGTLTDPRWFDAHAITSAGNLRAAQMQAGFTVMRSTRVAAQWVRFLERGHDAALREAMLALEVWNSDNVPFPGAAYATYIEELYQQNRLVAGTHYVAGRRVDLGAIAAPTLVIVADRDHICPPQAAFGLVRAREGRAPPTRVLTVPGGHVSAVVGARAARLLYPAMVEWLSSVGARTAATTAAAASAVPLS